MLKLLSFSSFYIVLSSDTFLENEDYHVNCTVTHNKEACIFYTTP